MKNLITFGLFIVFATTIGCNDPVQTEPTTKTVNVPGQISVQFKDRANINDAYKLMDDLSLNAIDLSSLELKEEENWGTVGVPDGKEDYWSFMITHYPIVLSAHLKTKKVPA